VRAEELAGILEGAEVDADNPPVRLLLGSWLLPMIKKIYEGRLETWDKWADVSHAQGNRAG
jgi:hypothetical protein